MHHARRNAWAVVVTGVLASLGGCSSCQEETEEKPAVVAPPPGAATSSELSTNIGLAIGLDIRLAPSSTRWTHVFSIDERRAVLIGEVTHQVIALFTDDAGVSWRSMRAERGAWLGAGVGDDGTLVVATGTRQRPKNAPSGGATPPIDSAVVHFVPPGEDRMGAPTKVFEQPDAGAGVLVPFERARPGVLSNKSAAFVAESRPRQPILLYAVPLGATQPAPSLLPPGEIPIGVFLGHPPSLMTTRGSRLLIRPVPAAEKPFADPVPIEGAVVPASGIAQWSSAPTCEAGAWSYIRVPQAPKRSMVLGVSPNENIFFELPPSTLEDAPLGCGNGHVVVMTQHPETSLRHPAVCNHKGECTISQNPPFREFEGSERQLQLVGTEGGAAAALAVQSPTQWGLYVTQSSNEGKLFDVQRVVGEGEGDLGRFELGALLGIGKRTLLILSAPVTGSQNRGWYVIASDDGGGTWGPP
jgi:hypothetical protein